MARAAVTAPPLDGAQVQGLVVRGYGRLPHARFLLASIADGAALRALLTGWAEEVTTGDQPDAPTAFNLAFTAPGLVAAGLPREVVEGGFAAAFVEGMVGEHRSRILGDVGAADPRRWAWGGPDTPPVHALLLVYAASAELLDAPLAALRAQAAGALDIVAELPTDPLRPTEPFGFVDGISQPRLAGLGGGLPTGEFVLGHPNAYGQLTERPLLAADTDPDGLLPRDANGAADLGHGGSYLVLRQLRQDVEGFRAFLRERTRTPDGAEDPTAQKRLGAKIVGRWPNGAPLVLAPDRDDQAPASAEFGYHAADPEGLRCPLGAHIRRANPRDALEPRPGTAESRALTDRHRLLRRGRSYTDGEERGLHFLCLVADLSRQYEFVQHTWIGDPAFNGLQGQPDPLVAPRSPGGTTFVEEARPVRRRHRDLPEFVRMRGGAYFFLPAPSALRYLARMPG
jgi:Dyp-type peroxidase family